MIPYNDIYADRILFFMKGVNLIPHTGTPSCPIMLCLWLSPLPGLGSRSYRFHCLAPRGWMPVISLANRSTLAMALFSCKNKKEPIYIHRCHTFKINYSLIKVTFYFIFPTLFSKLRIRRTVSESITRPAAHMKSTLFNIREPLYKMLLFSLTPG